MKKKGVKWLWDENYKSNFVESNGFRYSYLFNEENETGNLIREDSFGNSEQLWEHQEVSIYSASLLISNGTLFIGLFCRTATGNRIVALDLSSRQIIWEKPVRGLGSIGHSRYSNQVQLRIIEDQLVVFGWESAGKYIEIIDPKNGNIISTKKEKK